MGNSLISTIRLEIERLGKLGGDGFQAVVRQTFREVVGDRVGLAAAGCAFYATLALFPGMSMVISIYGLAFDPATVTPQLDRLRDLLPPSAYTLISQWLQQLVAHKPQALTFNLALSIAVGLWSASAGTRSLIAAVELAYNTKRSRGFLQYQALAIGLTLGNIIGVAGCIAALVLLPAGLTFLDLPHAAIKLLGEFSLILLMVFVFFSIGLLYRFGPGRPQAPTNVITPGAALATGLWLLASTAFSFYVGHVSAYGALYGPLGTVVGLMMWFYISAFVVLMGAELNAAMEAYAPARPSGTAASTVVAARR